MPLGAHKTALMGAAGVGGFAFDDAWGALDLYTYPGGTPASITFTSDGSNDPWENYDSLVLIGTQIESGATGYAQNMYCQMNGSSTSHPYWVHYMTKYGGSSSHGATTTTSTSGGMVCEVLASYAYQHTKGAFWITFDQIDASDNGPIYRARSSSTSGDNKRTAGGNPHFHTNYSSGGYLPTTDALTSIKLTLGGNFIDGRICLYGVRKDNG